MTPLALGSGLGKGGEGKTERDQSIGTGVRTSSGGKSDFGATKRRR